MFSSGAGAGSLSPVLPIVKCYFASIKYHYNFYQLSLRYMNSG